MSYELKRKIKMAVILFAFIILGCFTVYYSLGRVDSPEKEDQEMSVKDSSYTYKSFSYLSLEPIMKELDRRLDSIPDRIGFCCSCIMESEHYILIGLTDTTARNIQDFRDNVMDSPVFRFVQSEPVCFDVEVIEIK